MERATPGVRLPAVTEKPWRERMDPLLQESLVSLDRLAERDQARGEDPHEVRYFTLRAKAATLTMLLERTSRDVDRTLVDRDDALAELLHSAAGDRVALERARDLMLTPTRPNSDDHERAAALLSATLDLMER